MTTSPPTSPRARTLVGAWLGDGWYRGKYGFDGGHPQHLRHRPVLIAQLEVEYDDGTHHVVATDGT